MNIQKQLLEKPRCDLVYGHLWERCPLWPLCWQVEHFVVWLFPSHSFVWAHASHQAMVSVVPRSLALLPTKTSAPLALPGFVSVCPACHGVFLHILCLGGVTWPRASKGSKRNSDHDLVTRRCFTPERIHCSSLRSTQEMWHQRHQQMPGGLILTRNKELSRSSFSSQSAFLCDGWCELCHCFLLITSVFL